MTTSQLSLFGAAKPNKTQEPRVNARNAKNQAQKLRRQLDSAKEDLAQCEYNIAEVQMHSEASHAGKIDTNWWQGAFHFGIWAGEIGTTYREGKYPIKVYRWIRHLLCTLHAERRDIRAAIQELEQQLAVVAPLIDSGPTT